MRNNFLKIAKLIPEKLHYLVWKDESRDTFVLTKFCEIHRLTEDTLRMICWSKSIYRRIKKAKIIYNYDFTDDGLFIGEFKNSDLPKILNFGIHFRRPNKNGKWLADKKIRLAHDIRPYDGHCQRDHDYNFKFYQKLDPQIKSRLFGQKSAKLPKKPHQVDLEF
jgi:hypothetical protein